MRPLTPLPTVGNIEEDTRACQEVPDRQVKQHQQQRRLLLRRDGAKCQLKDGCCDTTLCSFEGSIETHASDLRYLECFVSHSVISRYVCSLPLQQMQGFREFPSHLHNFTSSHSRSHSWIQSCHITPFCFCGRISFRSCRSCQSYYLY